MLWRGNRKRSVVESAPVNSRAIGHGGIGGAAFRAGVGGAGLTGCGTGILGVLVPVLGALVVRGEVAAVGGRVLAAEV